MASAPFNTDHAFQSDGLSPYCTRCELLSWMHSEQGEGDEPRADIAAFIDTIPDHLRPKLPWVTEQGEPSHGA